MSRHTNWLALLLSIGAIAVFAACGSDATTPAASDNQAQAVEPTTEQVANTAEDAHDDDDAHADDDNGHEATIEAHVESPHEDIHEDVHEEEHSEAMPHTHGEAVIDPDAPINHVIATEFGYAPGDFEIEAGHTFTIMLHNEGALEHDVTIEDFEEAGGIHLVAGEDGLASFTLDDPGEYTYYCTVPGHRDAGMVGTIHVEAHGHGVEEDHAEGDEHGEEDHHEEGDEHGEEEHAEDEHGDEANA